MRFGYKASAEQFAPRELLGYAVEAERIGLESVAISDHFQPWRHTGGHGPAALPWLGAVAQATGAARLGTSVLTPTLRYHPSVIAQAFATLACLTGPGRVFLGVGTGEALNETAPTGAEWPSGKERRARLAEAVELIGRLWSEERVTYEGAHYRTDRATVYDRPEVPVPILMAAGGPIAAKLAGRLGDGLICTSGKDPGLYRELLDKAQEGGAGEGFERLIEIKLSYDHDVDFAREACGWWAALGLSGEEKSGVDDPIEMERLADAAADRAHERFIVSADPDEIVERIRPYVELGFDHLVFHAPGLDQHRFLTQFGADVLPRLRSAFAG